MQSSRHPPERKEGTGKTTTCENLWVGLAMEGKKVLMVDVDPQASLTISMGWPKPDELDTPLSTLMGKVLEVSPFSALTKEVLQSAEKRRKHQLDQLR